MPKDAKGWEVWGKRSEILQFFRKNNLALVKIIAFQRGMKMSTVCKTMINCLRK